MNTPQFIHRDANHVVIQRIGDGRWVEHARFAEITDAANYAIWRNQQYGEIFAAVKVEMLVVGANEENVARRARRRRLHPTGGETPRPPVTPEEAGDARVTGAIPGFDS